MTQDRLVGFSKTRKHQDGVHVSAINAEGTQPETLRPIFLLHRDTGSYAQVAQRGVSSHHTACRQCFSYWHSAPRPLTDVSAGGCGHERQPTPVRKYCANGIRHPVIIARLRDHGCTVDALLSIFGLTPDFSSRKPRIQSIENRRTPR